MGTAVRQTLVAERDYLAGEREADVRHEYVDGVLFAMGGASRAHNQIATNLVDYLTVSQDERTIERFTRDADGWTSATFTGDGNVELAPIGLSLPMDELYADVLASGRS